MRGLLLFFALVLIVQTADHYEFKNLINKPLTSGPTIMYVGNDTTWSLERSDGDSKIVPV